MPRYDLILKGGTVLDPANGLEERADLAIVDGRVGRVETDIDPAQAGEVIDVQGKWVMPGQIDTHAHVAGLARNWDPAIGYGMLAKAGTTTVLDMGGSGPTLIDGIKRRGAGLNVAGVFALIPGSTIPRAEPSLKALKDIVLSALRQGCVGVKLLGGYHPFTPETTANVIKACNDQHAYVGFHLGTTESGSHLGGLREVPELVGGGRLHVCHINSYCRGVITDARDECDEALEILEGMSGHLNSEAYHAVPNGTSGRCDKNGAVMADVPRNCLRLRGYTPDIDGMRQAIEDGYASVVAQKGDEVVYVKRAEARKMFEETKTNVGMSFPVNLPESAFRLVTAKNRDGNFIVDAVSTDGGSHPRNVAIQSTMALVQFGALTPLEMATKLSWNPSRMVGLLNKGHFSPGADADVTVLDPAENKPSMSLVAGKRIMADGQVVGSGGTLLVTREGERVAASSGLRFETLDLGVSKLYA